MKTNARVTSFIGFCAAIATGCSGATGFDAETSGSGERTGTTESALTALVNQAIPAPIFVNIYWDTNWDNDNPSLTMSKLDGQMRQVFRSTYLSALAEYGVTAPTFFGSITPAPQCAPKAPATVGFYDPFTVSISGFIACEHDYGPAILRAPNVVYNVILPPSSIESDAFTANFCAGGGTPAAWHYHGLPSSFFGGLPIFTIQTAHPNCGGNAALLGTLLHEMVEAATDPFPYDISIFPPHAILEDENEIADLCEGRDVFVGALRVPTYWSNARQRCVSGHRSRTRGDVDRDKFSDIILTGGTGWGTIPVAYSLGNDSFIATNAGITSGVFGVPYWAQLSGVKPVAGDFDGDGAADFALVGGSGWNTVPVAFSNANRTGTFHDTNGGVTSGDTGFASYAQVSSAKPVSGDFNGDGRGDIALVGAGWNTLPVAFSNGDGTFRGTNRGPIFGDTTGFPFFAQWTGARPVSGDYDGDGRSDIVLVGGNGWTFLPQALSLGDGTWVATYAGIASGDPSFPAYSAQAGAKAVAGDFNGDGFDDIALVGGSGWATIPIAFSNADGSYRVTNFSPVGSDWHPDFQLTWWAQSNGVTPVSGDFDGDGLDDIALVGLQVLGVRGLTIPVAYSLGDGTFMRPNLGPVMGDAQFPVYGTMPGARPVTR